MKDMKIISVAMCTYNGEAFLREQLDSIRSQTFPPDELIICDDVSQDGTLDILYSFKETCNFPVKIIANQKNVGVCKNFENAIMLCSGDVIVLADQDDIWQPFKIEIINKYFLENPLCGYVFSNAELIDKYGTPIGRNLWDSIGFTEKRQKKYTAGSQLEVMLRDGNFVYGMAMAFRTSFKQKLMPIDSRYEACTHDTWISLMLSAIGAHGVAIQESLVKYRQHEKQLAGGGRPFSFIELFRSAFSKRAEKDLELAGALDNIAKRFQHEEENTAYVVDFRNKLTAKATHLRARSLANSSRGFQKLKLVYRESISGRYGQYSGSIKSILKDLIVG